MNGKGYDEKKMVTIKTKPHQKALDFAMNALERYEFVKEIILFGSCAREEQQRESDVNLLVICNRRLTSNEIVKIRGEVICANYRLPDVDVKFSYFINDYDNCIDEAMNADIKRYGISLWKRDVSLTA